MPLSTSIVDRLTRETDNFVRRGTEHLDNSRWLLPDKEEKYRRQFQRIDQTTNKIQKEREKGGILPAVTALGLAARNTAVGYSIKRKVKKEAEDRRARAEMDPEEDRRWRMERNERYLKKSNHRALLDSASSSSGITPTAGELLEPYVPKLRPVESDSEGEMDPHHRGVPKKVKSTSSDTLQGYQDQDHRQQPASSSRRSTENVRSAPNEVGAKPLEARPSRSAESTKTAQRVPAQAPSGSQRSHTNASTKRATEPQSQKPVEIPRRPSERQAQVDEKKGSHEPPKPSNVAKEKTKDEPRLERVEENSKLVGEGAKQTEGKPKPAVQPRPSTRVDAQKPPVTQRKFFVANRGSLSPSFDSEITLTNGDNNLLNRLPKEPLPAPAAPANTLPQRRATTQATALTSAQDTATPARRATTPRTAPPRRDNDSRDQRSRPADPPQPAQSTNANAKSFPVIDLRPLTPRPPRGTDPTRVVGTLKPVAPRERHVSQPTPVAPSASSSTKANSTKANGSAKTPGPEVGQRAPTEHSRGRSTSRHTHSPSQQDTTNHSDEERGRSITPKPAERRKSPVLHNPPPSDTVPARPALRPPAKPATGFWHLLKNDTKRQNSNPERQLRIVSPPPKSPPHSPAYSSDTYQTVSDTEQSPRTRTKSKSTRPKGAHRATASETREYPMYNTYYGGPQDSEEDFEPFVPPGPGESRQAPRASTPAMFAEPEEDPTPYDPGVVRHRFFRRSSRTDELPIMDYDTSWAVPSIPPNVDLLHDTLLGITPYQLSSDVALRLVPTSPPPVQWNQQRNMPHMAGIPYQPPVGPTPYFWYGRWWP